MKRVLAFRLCPLLSKSSTRNRFTLRLQSRELHSLLRQYSTVQDTHLWDKSDAPPIYYREGNVNDSSLKRQHNCGVLPQETTVYAQQTQPLIETSGSQRSNSNTSSGDTRPSSAREQLRETLKNMTRVRKRKAEAPLEGLSKLRRRGNAVDKAKKYSGPNSATNKLNDKNRNPQAQQHEFYILPTIKTLTEHDLPEVPKSLFNTPKAALNNAIQRPRGKIAATFTQYKLGGVMSCTLTCTFPSIEPLSVSAQHNARKTAEKNAYGQLIAHLHAQGILENLFPKRVKSLNQETIKAEKDAKTDIYNYAALYGFVPKFGAKFVSRLISTRRKFVEVTIELPEQNISVTGRGENLRVAEISAALRFKEEAEKYHAQQGTASIVIRDSAALNTTTVRNFFDYYKMITPGVKIDVNVTDSTEYTSLGGSHKLAQVLINGEPIGESVSMSTKKKAEDLAYLTAAMVLKAENPKLFTNFSQAQRDSKGDILLPVAPVTMKVNEDCVHLMRDTMLSVGRARLPDGKDALESEEEASEARRARFRQKLLPGQAHARATRLVEAYNSYRHNPALAEIRKKREDLPMNQYRRDVIQIVKDHTYSIIIGATGSGKTTQVPQILFEEAINTGKVGNCNIICTQPRRIAAVSVAQRVAVERAERLQDTVGYHVRFDARVPILGGSITYCTTGILLQQLQHSPDEVLDSTSHIIIDEVHERDMLIDFLLIIIKKVMAERLSQGKKTPKVILMSATMDSELFASYFKNGSNETIMSDCPTLSVPGRTFPVKEIYLENLMNTLNEKYTQSQLGFMQTETSTKDYYEAEKRFHQTNAAKSSITLDSGAQAEESIINWKEERRISAEGIPISNDAEDALIPLGLIATTIAHIANTTDDGAVLVFLPGLDEILKVNTMLTTSRILGVDFTNSSKFKVHMLHSSIPAGQTDVFKPVLPGCRKIILATNIAETSITIPDVQYVVDTGKLREKQYDQIRRITALKCTWISKSNSKQRAGRAGRVQNGNYYALFTKARFESMRAIGLPELLRSDLQETCLDIKGQKFQTPIREFLAEAIEPPPAQAVDASVSNLIALNALTEDEKLTPLGGLLASLPVHPTLGKMIVLGVIFRCLDPMLLLGAGTGERSIFLSPPERRSEAKKAYQTFIQGSNSDHIGFLNAIREMRAIRQSRGQYAMLDFAHSKFIHANSFKVVEATARQIEEILEGSCIIPRTQIYERKENEFGHPSLNINSRNEAIIKALILAGLHPNLAVGIGPVTFRTPGERGTVCHPQSANAVSGKDDSGRRRYGLLLSYTTMSRSNDGGRIYIRDTTEISPLMASLFGGRLSQSPDNFRILLMDKWLPFYVRSEDGRAMKTIFEFRKTFERLLANAFQDLSSKKHLAENPGREQFANGLVEVLMRDALADRATSSSALSEGRNEEDGRRLARRVAIS